MTPLRPRRSVLYLPASNPRALAKAATLPADVLILDLEDSVPPEAKDEARRAAVAAAEGGALRPREVAIRVNGLATPEAAEDLAAVAASRCDVVVVPKVEGPEDAARAVALAGGKPVWVLIETPRAVLQAAAIAATPGIAGLVAGFADLAKDLRLKAGRDRTPLFHAMSVIVTAARAAGILAFDGVFVHLDDPAGLEAETAQAVAFGFDGKTCIHPTQLETVNRAFSPSPDEVAEARAIVAAFEAARAEGRGVATHRGRVVEALHVAEAQRVLAVARAIGLSS
ncbi:CoA ester lyase [Thermaurantiacus sp.]|uniref:HpcH/HpaI aldolase/citrate lyase family protein n=1 Tax=Thermaurantiacus sp. TaxID=2820283 RepID=UPI00298EF09B|nr:CoA ester lyase [Thermaurantiacus sp.]